MNVKLTKLKEKKNVSKIRFGSADFESNPITKEFKLVSISYRFRKKYTTKTFFNVKDFLDFIVDKEIQVVYFFNLKFDISFILDFIIEFEQIDSTNFFIIESESQTLGLIYNYKDFKIIFKDFYPFILTSLEKGSELFKVQFKKYKVDFYTCNLSELQKHCELDTLMLYELIVKFRELSFSLFKVDCLDKRVYSLASYAIKVYRTNFLSYNKQFYNPFIKRIKESYQPNIKLFNFVKKTYKGGFTNAFDNKIHFNCYYYDINSSYPFQSTLINFPVGNYYFTRNLQVFLNNTVKINQNGFLKCIIHFNNNPCLPVIVNDLENKKSFTLTNGSVKEYITSLEYEYLINNGIKIDFIKGVYFSGFDTSYSLSNFMQNIYNLRLTYPKDNPLNYILKIVMNALSGKFGQKIFSERNEYKIIDSSSQVEGLIIRSNKDKAILLTKQESISTKSYQIVSWISLITALGRIQLIKFIIKTDGFYCDTDSVLTDIEYNDCSDKLGGWKLEKKCLYFRSFAPKMYALCYKEFDKLKNKEKLKREVRLKGIPLKYRKKLFMEFFDLNRTEFKIEKIHVFYSFKQMLRLKKPEFKSGQFTGAGYIDKELKPKLKIIL